MFFGMAPGVRELCAQSLKGGIRGYVVDAEFNTPIANAQIALEGRGLVTQSGSEGEFTFTDIDPGTYVLEATRDGFVPERVSGVVVNAGGFGEAMIRMAQDLYELDEFVVPGAGLLEEGALAPVELRQDALSFKNVVGAEFISKIGASDAGAALQKTSGVSVIGGETVVVRGLADRYNSIVLNGAGVPSSNPDKRAVDIDLFPGSIVRTLETSKTFTPDLPGESTGGSVDIVTKSIPEKDFLKVKVGTGYETQSTGNREFVTYNGPGTGVWGSYNSRKLPGFIRNAELPRGIAGPPNRLADQELRDEINATLPRTMGTSRKDPGPDFGTEWTFGKRGEFFGKPAGFLFGVDYRKRHRYNDGREGRYEFLADGTPVIASRRTTINRGGQSVRGSILAVAAIEPKPENEVKVTFFGNRTADDRASFRVNRDDVAPFGDIDIEEADTSLREALTYTERRLWALQGSGVHTLESGEDPATITWSASYNESQQFEPDHRFVSADASFDLTQFFPPPVTPVPLFRRYWRELFDKRWNAALDFEDVLFSDAERLTKIKFGGSFDSSHRDYRADNFAYNDRGFNNLLAFPSALKPSPFPGATWADVWNYNNPLNVDARVPRLGHFLYRFTPVEFYTADQIIPAGFVMFDTDITSKLNTLFGFRVEQTNISIEASDICNVEEQVLAIALLPPELRTQENINDLADPEACRTNADIQSARFANINETHILPAVSSKYDLTDTMAVRAAFSRTIARPTFKELAPVLIRDAESGDFFAGNSSLVESQISNYDVRWEWFPDSGGFFAVSGFTKRIEDPIERVSFGELEQFANTGEGQVWGFELEADKNLGALNEALRGFTIGGNYSYIRSVGLRPVASNFGRTRRLQGQPEYLLNVNFSYEHPVTGIFMGLFLNVTGAYIDALGASSLPDIVALPRTTLNAVIQIPLKGNSEISLRANNLTRSGLTRVYDGPGTPLYQLDTAGTSYSVSFSKEW
ncbi:MAG: TonB-dependent receptor [Verrucomicrobiota bacterium]